MGSIRNTSKVPCEFLPLIRFSKDGRVERLVRTQLIPHSILPQTHVQSKHIVLSPKTGLSATLFRPKSNGKRLPIIVCFHGRCFFVDTPYSPMHQTFLHTVVEESEAVIVSFDYRKAPEHPLPIGYNDCFTMVRWVAAHSQGAGPEEWLGGDNVDFERVFLMGDGAGANIAHNIAMRVAFEEILGFTLHGIIVMNPFFWGKDAIDGELRNESGRSIVDGYWMKACPTSNGSDHPWVNPGHDPKLSSLGCDKVLVFVSEKDVMKHRSWYYHELVMKSGWGGKIEVFETQGEDHLFHLEKPNSEKAKDFIKKLVSFIHET